jgi:hypothetical protein
MFTRSSIQETAVLITPSTRPEAIANALQRVLSHEDLQELVALLVTEAQAK